MSPAWSRAMGLSDDLEPTGDLEIDPRRCPLCGADNDCGRLKGQPTCWCWSVAISRRGPGSRAGRGTRARLCLPSVCDGGALTRHRFVSLSIDRATAAGERRPSRFQAA